MLGGCAGDPAGPQRPGSTPRFARAAFHTSSADPLAVRSVRPKNRIMAGRKFAWCRAVRGLMSFDRNALTGGEHGISGGPMRKLLLALAVLVGLAAGAPSAAQADACNPPTNPVACENTKPGTPASAWQVNGAGDATIQGYATSMSVTPGQTIKFKVKASAKYHLDILRLGYYQGNGARKVAANLSPSATLPQTQPACQTTAPTGLVDCGNWAVSASWTVPTDAVSGVYIAHLKRDDTGGDSQIPFVVRDDSSHSDVLVSTSDATWQAYNKYGG